jgi:hypothetical protein
VNTVGAITDEVETVTIPLVEIVTPLMAGLMEYPEISDLH